MSKKRIAIGVVFAVVMSPVMVAGFVYQCFKAYFESGKDLAGLAAEWLDEKLED